MKEFEVTLFSKCSSLSFTSGRTRDSSSSGYPAHREYVIIIIIIIQYIKDFPTELKRSDLGDLRVLLINSEW